LSANHKILIFVNDIFTIYIQSLPYYTNISLGIVQKPLKFWVWRAANLESNLRGSEKIDFKIWWVPSILNPASILISLGPIVMLNVCLLYKFNTVELDVS
jgi:hypothetical protein